MRTVARWSAIALWLIVATPCIATAELPQQTGVSERPPISTPQQLDLPSYRDPESALPGVGVTSQIFTALGTVLGVVALGAYLYKRFALRWPQGGHRDGTVRVLSRTYLGPKDSLCLVQVGPDLLLLGQTGSGITLLHTLPSNTSSGSSGGEANEATLGPGNATGDGDPSGFSRRHGETPAGLEHRLKRLNKLWGTGVSD